MALHSHARVDRSPTPTLYVRLPSQVADARRQRPSKVPLGHAPDVAIVELPRLTDRRVDGHAEPRIVVGDPDVGLEDGPAEQLRLGGDGRFARPARAGRSIDPVNSDEFAVM